MTQKRASLSDLPDFLQNSPDLPILSEEYESHSDSRHAARARYTIPSIKRVLRGLKQWRNTCAIILVLFVLYRMDLRSLVYGPMCFSSEPVTPATHVDGDADWSQYAYVQYVTNAEYLCNSLMFFETLHRLGSKAERVIMYPSKYTHPSDTRESMMLLQAEAAYGVKLVPIEVQHKPREYYVWADSLTKLLAFNQTQYKRVIIADSDSTLLQPMDELFFLPSQPVVMPRAYWLEKGKPMLSSHIMVLEPSTLEFKRIEKEIKNAVYGVYDMEIVNKLYGRRKNCIVLPHRRYALLSGEFRSRHHGQYLGNDIWDPKTVFEEAKLIHFSDDPLPKPWEATWDQVKEAQPLCDNDGVSPKDCQARHIWLTLYSEYAKRAKDNCWIEERKPSK